MTEFLTSIDAVSVWTYSKGLETGSARFNQPGDYLIYVMFVGLVILVSEYPYY